MQNKKPKIIQNPADLYRRKQTDRTEKKKKKVKQHLKGLIDGLFFRFFFIFLGYAYSLLTCP